MKQICDYCGKLVSDHDINFCSDCFEEGCFKCINDRHCCNGLGEDQDFLEQEDNFDEEQEETQDY